MTIREPLIPIDIHRYERRRRGLWTVPSIAYRPLKDAPRRPFRDVLRVASNG